MIARTLLLLALLLSPGVAAKKKGKQDEDGTETLKAEISAEGGVQEAALGELSDALKDIMAVLEHGSDSSKEGALERLVELAVHTGEAGREQATAFRMAVVDGGALPALVTVLGDEEPRRQHLAAAAIHALALDDPTTDADNEHQLEICKANAVPPLVKLLSSDNPGVQHAATGALSALAENPACQAMIAAEGATTPLLQMASYGSDMQKLGALGALDVLTLNNAEAAAALKQDGAADLLQGISTMGSPLLREQATAFGTRLSDTGPATKLDASAHVKAARDTRMRYDGVRQRAFRMMQGWGDEGHPPPG